MNFVSWNSLDDDARESTLRRPANVASEQVSSAAARIVDVVKVRGDDAIREFTLSLDKADVPSSRLTESEIALAIDAVSDDVKSAVRDAIERIRIFHEACKPKRTSVETAPGVVCERRPVPIGAVGLYVPAGRAPLPSTAIMLGVPSTIAGNPMRVLCVPPRPDGSVDPVVVFAAAECGIANIFKIGGAQAIAAMAYGTSSVPKCDKLFGPGNAYVTAAKLLVSQDPAGAAIDMPAGPSEVMVIADESAKAEFIAADMLSQCEHGPDSQAMLVTTSKDIAEAVQSAITKQLADLPTRQVASEALSSSATILVESIDEAIGIANRYAPEHLIIQTLNGDDVADRITAAGSVFIGPWTPETLGDYCSGTNHVLPTYGYARAYSGLSVDSFVRHMTIQTASRNGLATLANTAKTLARAEGLEAHARAVQIRLEAPNRN